MGADSPFAILVVQWLGVAMISTFVYVLARAHFNKTGSINMSTLIVDDGVVTLAKFGGLLALLTSTWIVVLMAIKGTLTEGVFIGYSGVWGGVKVAADFTKRQTPGSESKQVTVTETKTGPTVKPDSPYGG